MDNSVLVVLIGCFQAVAVAVIGGLFARDSKTRKKLLADAEIRAVLRAEESRLMMTLLSADTQLTVATARAVKEGKTNGKMDAALSAAESAQEEYQTFLSTIALKQIAK